MQGPPCHHTHTQNRLERSLGVKNRYRPLGSTGQSNVLEKTAHCGEGIIESFSGRTVLNGKGSGGVCMCVHPCARVRDKHERGCWWHLHEWVNLPLSPPHTAATIVLLGSGGLTAAALLPQTHTHTETWWGRLKTVKMSVCKLWRWTLMGTAAVELMRHIWEDRAERRQQIWEGAMRNRYKWAERRQKEGGSMFDLTFNKPLPSVSLDVPLLCSGIWLKQ